MKLDNLLICLSGYP